MSKSEALNQVKSLLSPEEIIQPDTPAHVAESSTWSVVHNKQPALVIRPKDIDSLSRLIKHLASTDLNFSVRSQGFGNASAEDVLISLSAFNDFHYDEEKEIVTLGAGQPWRAYYQQMTAQAPGKTIVACRTPSIGIGGSVLAGGFSWLSNEFGAASDPSNLLDAQVVKLDGSVVWASTDPELMRALRGTCGAFCVITTFKFRAFEYNHSIYAGPILVPRSQARTVGRELARMTARRDQPRVAMFLYMMQQEFMKFMGATEDMFVVHAFDANGEEHGRSEEGFKWALEIPGAIDQTRVFPNLLEVAELQGGLEPLKGLSSTYWAPMATPDLTEDMVMRALDWYSKVEQAGGTIGKNAWLLFELKCVTDAVGDLSGSGWPRPKGTRQCVLIGAGHNGEKGGRDDKVAQRLVQTGPQEILGEGVPVHLYPNALEEWHDTKAQVYGENYEWLKDVKRKHDPKNKLGGPIAP